MKGRDALTRSDPEGVNRRIRIQIIGELLMMSVIRNMILHESRYFVFSD
jgi:hypothetical protein